jgi:hypothetical protein
MLAKMPTTALSKLVQTSTKIFLGVSVVALWLATRKRNAGAQMVASGLNVLPLNQGASTWGSKLVGNSTDVKNTYARVGCVVTALTIAANTLLGKNFTPDQLRPNGGAGVPSSVYSGASIGNFEAAARALGLSALEAQRIRNSPRTAASLANMRLLLDDTLSRGGVATVRVDYDTATPEDNHTLICFSRDQFGYKCADPAGGVIVTLEPSTLTVRRSSSKTYAATGVGPIFRA